MRYLLALLLILAGAAGGAFAYYELTKGPPVVLPPPTYLEVSAAGTPLLPGGWTNSSSLTLAAQEQRGTAARIEVEVRPQGQKFSDSPTATSASGTGDPQTTVRLADGHYRWQARLHNGRGVSPWVAYHGVVNVDTQPPSPPLISSSTDPDPAKLYHSSTASFAWQSADTGSGVAGYAYRLDADPSGRLIRQELRTPLPTVTLNGLDTGKWYFHVAARDNAGNWGRTATFPIRIDVTPPGLAHVRFNLFQFDPQFNALRVSFAVTRPATVIRVGVYRQGDDRLVRFYKLGRLSKGQQQVVWWDGKDASGTPVAAGAYAIYIRAIDRYGHSSLAGWRDFVVDYHRILISLSQQRLWAYDGNKVVLTSLVTTGNPALPTPTGTYHVMSRFHPFTFISPWPKSSPYYYKPSKVSYALLFREGGYFIHDAPWRSAFGPGTNSQLGTPGQNYTGTHGCVNVPPDVARQLYGWAQIGTVVQVVK